ncbi:MAG: HNH endonuclease [Nitrospirae bacterium]|uniref:HNH endonuclease n=1 Tax=Candidatus Magnetobacterium casense TaxID=1455061 RepID=UPI000590EDBC|nr:HNH endonuclease [Candidatus Magnetobacterium casensis]MBF0338806.1 HNH endonuclease [Nitrospirota bacterium]
MSKHRANAKRCGARNKIRKFLEDRVGEIVTTEQISEIAGIRDYQRRIRELRGEEGMQSLSYRDRNDLKPNEYILVSKDRLPRFSHKIDKTLRAGIIERNGLTCSMCGVTAGESDPYDPNRKITLHVDHIDPDGPTTDENLRTLCHNCNEGRSNLIIPPRPNTLSVIRNIRRLARDEQKRIYEELRKKFEPTE